MNVPQMIKMLVIFFFYFSCGTSWTVPSISLRAQRTVLLYEVNFLSSLVLIFPVPQWDDWSLEFIALCVSLRCHSGLNFYHFTS